MSDSDNIKNILTGLFKNNNKLSRGYNTYTIEQVWRETFGEVISGYTTGVKFSSGILTVFISSSALKQEISMTKETIVERLNRS